MRIKHVIICIPLSVAIKQEIRFPSDSFKTNKYAQQAGEFSALPAWQLYFIIAVL